VIFAERSIAHDSAICGRAQIVNTSWQAVAVSYRLSWLWIEGPLALKNACMSRTNCRATSGGTSKGFLDMGLYIGDGDREIESIMFSSSSFM
jgi:hypothetical protein